MTLYPDTVARAAAPTPQRDRIFIPRGADAAAAAALRSQGFITVAALSDTDTPQSLRCSHTLRGQRRRADRGERVAMANVAIIGAQWGDEGKGKVVDWLASRADIVVRFQGGHNAGHTLVVGNQTYKLSLLPSGIVRGKLGIIGNGVVLDPDALLSEIEKVRAQGLDVGPHNLRIAENTPLILPLHPALDKAREAARRGQDRHHRPRHRPRL
jgi:hypothetical protein